MHPNRQTYVNMNETLRTYERQISYVSLSSYRCNFFLCCYLRPAFRHFRQPARSGRSAGVHRPPRSGIDRLDRVRRADHGPDSRWNGRNGTNSAIRSPGAGDGRAALLRFPGEVGEPVQRPGFGRGRVNGLEVPGDLRLVPFRRILERIPQRRTIHGGLFRRLRRSAGPPRLRWFRGMLPAIGGSRCA
jgi:hypothetical protein